MPDAGGDRCFSSLTPEFLSYQRIRSDDRRTARSNIRILTGYFGDLTLAEITPAAINRMAASRLSGGTARSTVNRQRATLSMFFSWAAEAGYWDGSSPVKKVKRFHESPGRGRFLSGAEATRLVRVCAEHLRSIVVIALHTGGRLSELLALTWFDIDLRRRLIRFRSETTKSKNERFVPMSPVLRRELLRLEVQAVQLYGAGMSRNTPVFRYRGKGIHSVARSWQAARRRAELPGVWFHTLRHTFASWAAMNGMPLTVLQYLLGHHSIKLTQRYAHLSPEFVQESVVFIGPPRHDRPKSAPPRPPRRRR